MSKSLARFLEDLVEAIPVLIVGENFLSRVAAKDYMVDCSRCMYAWFSCHS
jgi:hypothetical protein